MRIDLHLQGSGLCYTKGGSRFVIAIAGYLGAVAWGILIYKLAEGIRHKTLVAISLATILGVTAILYGRDLTTLVILAILFSLFITIIKLQTKKIAKVFLKFIGIYVLCDAVRSPLHLLDGKSCGDGATLWQITHIPEIFWISLWFLVGVGGALYLLFSRKMV